MLSQGIFSEDKKPRHQDSKSEKPGHPDPKTKKPRYRVSAEFWPLFTLSKNKTKQNKNECYTLVLMILAKSVLADSINNISWLVQGTIT